MGSISLLQFLAVAAWPSQASKNRMYLEKISQDHSNLPLFQEASVKLPLVMKMTWTLKKEQELMLLKQKGKKDKDYSMRKKWKK